MTSFALGDSPMASGPFLFTDRHTAGTKEPWMPLLKDNADLKAKMLLYSNDETLESYLGTDLWSVNYFLKKRAERFADYTDGYAC